MRFMTDGCGRRLVDQGLGFVPAAAPGLGALVSFPGFAQALPGFSFVQPQPLQFVQPLQFTQFQPAQSFVASARPAVVTELVETAGVAARCGSSDQCARRPYKDSAGRCCEGFDGTFYVNCCNPLTSTKPGTVTCKRTVASDDPTSPGVTESKSFRVADLADQFGSNSPSGPQLTAYCRRQGYTTGTVR